MNTPLRKDTAMVEMSATAAARRAFDAAHEERARAIREAFNWLFPSRGAR